MAGDNIINDVTIRANLIFGKIERPDLGPLISGLKDADDAAKRLKDDVDKTNQVLEDQEKINLELEESHKRASEQAKRSTDSNVAMADSSAQVGQGALKAARGIAFLTAAKEEDLRRAMEIIATAQGLFDLYEGGVGVIKGLVGMYRALAAAKAIDTAATATNTVATNANTAAQIANMLAGGGGGLARGAGRLVGGAGRALLGGGLKVAGGLAGLATYGVMKGVEGYYNRQSEAETAKQARMDEEIRRTQFASSQRDQLDRNQEDMDRSIRGIGRSGMVSRGDTSGLAAAVSGLRGGREDAGGSGAAARRFAELEEALGQQMEAEKAYGQQVQERYKTQMTAEQESLKSNQDRLKQLQDERKAIEDLRNTGTEAFGDLDAAAKLKLESAVDTAKQGGTLDQAQVNALKQFRGQEIEGAGKVDDVIKKSYQSRFGEQFGGLFGAGLDRKLSENTLDTQQTQGRIDLGQAELAKLKQQAKEQGEVIAKAIADMMKEQQDAILKKLQYETKEKNSSVTQAEYVPDGGGGT